MTASAEIRSRRGKRGVERWKMLLIPALIGVVLMLLLSWLLLRLEPEPLTADEILKKHTWSETELAETLSRAFAPQSNRGRRKEVLEHLRRELGKYPDEERKAIEMRALTGAVGESLRQLRAMPPAEQDKMVEAIRKRAERSYKELEKGKNAADLERLRNTPEGQAFATEVTKTIFTKMTAAEQSKFAPITEIWVKTMRLPTK